MNIYEIPDPYNTAIYQANLVQQTQELYINTILDNQVEQVHAQVEVEIVLVQGGVKLIYNKNTLHFKDSENQICFQREINGYFHSLGFLLEQISYPIYIYKCATLKEPKNYLVQTNELYLTKSEAQELHEIILQQLNIAQLIKRRKK